MEAARPRSPSRRPRRGSSARPLNTRLARASALLLLVPLLLVTLTVAGLGRCPAPALPPVFDGDTALSLATELANDHPRRVPGSPGADAAARWVEAKLALYGLDVETDRWRAELPDLGETQLTNVAAIVPGRTRDAVLVVAHRDTTDRGPGANDNASGTAALVELARGYAAAGTAAGRARPQHTLVFLSADGGAFGGVGAARFAGRERFRNRILAAVVLDGLAGSRRPRLELAGDGSHSPAPALVQTAAARIAEQTRREPAQPSVLRQLVDLALPFGVRRPGTAARRANLRAPPDDGRRHREERRDRRSRGARRGAVHPARACVALATRIARRRRRAGPRQLGVSCPPGSLRSRLGARNALRCRDRAVPRRGHGSGGALPAPGLGAPACAPEPAQPSPRRVVVRARALARGPDGRAPNGRAPAAAAGRARQQLTGRSSGWSSAGLLVVGWLARRASPASAPQAADRRRGARRIRRQPRGARGRRRSLSQSPARWPSSSSCRRSTPGSGSCNFTRPLPAGPRTLSSESASPGRCLRSSRSGPASTSAWTPCST